MEQHTPSQCCENGAYVHLFICASVLLCSSAVWLKRSAQQRAVQCSFLQQVPCCDALRLCSCGGAACVCAQVQRRRVCNLGGLNLCACVVDHCAIGSVFLSALRMRCLSPHTTLESASVYSTRHLPHITSLRWTQCSSTRLVCCFPALNGRGLLHTLNTKSLLTPCVPLPCTHLHSTPHAGERWIPPPGRHVHRLSPLRRARRQRHVVSTPC